MFTRFICVLSTIGLVGCAGLKKNDETFTAHAESFNILFLQIPGGDTQKRAFERVPQTSEIKTIRSTPSDTSSFLGVLNRIIGIDYTEVSGTIGK
jgi:hypothetical protein